MRIMFFLLLAVLGGCYGCVRDTSSVRRFEYAGALDTLARQYRDSVDGSYVIDLCAVFHKPQWDSLVIIPAYTPLSIVRDAEYCHVSYVLKSLEDVLYADWFTSVLFIKNRCVVGYSVLPGSPSLVYVTGYVNRAVMPVLPRSDCRVRLSKMSGEYGVNLYFMPFKTSAADSIFYAEVKERVMRGGELELDSIVRN